jgi:hypothetical protein
MQNQHPYRKGEKEKGGGNPFSESERLRIDHGVGDLQSRRFSVAESFFWNSHSFFGVLAQDGIAAA